MVAHEVKAIVLLNAQRLEGDLILETTCRDYEQYCTLPQVVAYSGIMCGLSAWSSDRQTACYKSSVAIARAISHS